MIFTLLSLISLNAFADLESDAYSKCINTYSHFDLTKLELCRECYKNDEEFVNGGRTSTDSLKGCVDERLEVPPLITYPDGWEPPNQPEWPDWYDIPGWYKIGDNQRMAFCPVNDNGVADCGKAWIAIYMESGRGFKDQLLLSMVPAVGPILATGAFLDLFGGGNDAAEKAAKRVYGKPFVAPCNIQQFNFWLTSNASDWDPYGAGVYQMANQPPDSLQPIHDRNGVFFATSNRKFRTHYNYRAKGSSGRARWREAPDSNVITCPAANLNDMECPPCHTFNQNSLTCEKSTLACGDNGMEPNTRGTRSFDGNFGNFMNLQTGNEGYKPDPHQGSGQSNLMGYVNTPDPSLPDGKKNPANNRMGGSSGSGSSGEGSGGGKGLGTPDLLSTNYKSGDPDFGTFGARSANGYGKGGGVGSGGKGADSRGGSGSGGAGGFQWDGGAFGALLGRSGKDSGTESGVTGTDFSNGANSQDGSAGKNSGNTDAEGYSDAYFDRIGMDENIFIVVSRKYRTWDETSLKMKMTDVKKKMTD